MDKILRRGNIGLSLLLLLSMSASIPCYSSSLEQKWPKFENKVQEKVQAQLEALRPYDLVMLVDASSSMSTRDCPVVGSRVNIAAVPEASKYSCRSRWDWCREELTNLEKDAHGILSDPLETVCFSSGTTAYSGPTKQAVASVFAQNEPFGRTDTTLAIRKQFQLYFDRKNSLGEKCKPLLITVISDGAPDNSQTLGVEIINATKKMQNPNELHILFLQIGNEKHGSKVLAKLDTDLMRQHAQFDIVSTKSFSQVLKDGLVTAMAEEAKQQTSPLVVASGLAAKDNSVISEQSSSSSVNTVSVVNALADLEAQRSAYSPALVSSQVVEPVKEIESISDLPSLIGGELLNDAIHQIDFQKLAASISGQKSEEIVVSNWPQ